MKIAFCNQDKYWGGLANNGGSLSIVHAVKVLKKMGHDAFVVTKSDRLTWIKHDKTLAQIPADTDVCIAVSASAVKPMLKKKPGKAKACWWVRGLETWQMPEKKIIERARKVKLLSNSEYLQKYFAAYDIDSTIIYQGIDIDKWKIGLNNSCLDEKPTIGFYITNRKSKRFSDALKIMRYFGDDCRYVGYGSKEQVHDELKKVLRQYNVSFILSPIHDEKLKIYNAADIWVCTSELEGLHNVGMEAALCGCLLICNGNLQSGTSDYAIDNQTAMVYAPNDWMHAAMLINSPKYSLIFACQDLIKEKIGTREQNMKKLIEVIS